MKCPKCGHEQENTFECESCGIIFEKYRQIQARIEAQEESTPIQISKRMGSPKSKGPSYGLVGVALGILACLAVYGFFHYTHNNASKNKILPNQIPVLVETVEKEQPHDGIAKTSRRAHATSSDIQRASNATVLIETSWGSGSGFFVDSGCHVITNRHVVELDSKTFELMKTEQSRLKIIIEIERREIARAKEQLNNVSDRSYREGIEKFIELRKQRLSEAKDRYEALVSALERIEYEAGTSVFNVTLIDHSQYSASIAQLSDRYDLALLELDSSDCPFIETGRSSRLRQGDPVYTVGHPIGLQYSVTSGIVSGFRRHAGRRYIQTDAPINPGNSGGPLIDRNGQVVGVTTMIIANTEGIGFAIPIEVVLEEFQRYIE
ncbi:MAG: trypsin-like peptidase domain-containing protein [Deltaproteobacteria bacterium]|nr:MAG: trypsin-like peptidase domain-containing protein [Deltaproteobacteria bacterium]